LDIFSELALLSRAASVRGRESGTVELLKRRWGPWLDDVRTGRLGNFVGLRRGTGPEPRPKVMAAAHMDGVGLVVTRVEGGGFLRVTSVGGIDRRLLLGQEVQVQGRRPLTGVIGARPPHLSSPEERTGTVPLEELYVDTGLAESEVKELVPPGSPVLYRQDLVLLRNGRAAGRCLDDAVGLVVLGVALEELARVEHQADFYVVGTVGEEAGRYPGAVTAAYDLWPQIAFAVDVTFGSYPGQNDPTGTYPLGGGPAIGVGPNCHPKLVALLEEQATEAGIPFSREVMPGATGTDAWGIQVVRGAIPTAVLSVPLRYMHTPVETVSLDDIASTGKLLARAVARVDRPAVEGLSCYEDKPRT